MLCVISLRKAMPSFEYNYAEYHYAVQHSVRQCAEGRYDECQCVNRIMSSIINPSVIMLNGIMLSVIVPSIIMLSVIKLNVVVLNVVAPYD
jgi:hypothetical protein